MNLTVVRSAETVKRSALPLELDDFEQELIDQYALAAVAVGTTDAHIAQERSVLFAFIRFLGRHVWTAKPQDVDRFLGHQRKELGLAKRTVYAKSGVLGRLFEFLLRDDLQPSRFLGVRWVADPSGLPAHVDVDLPRDHPREGLEADQVLRLANGATAVSNPPAGLWHSAPLPQEPMMMSVVDPAG